MSKLTEIQNELRVPKSQFNSFGKYNYRSCEDILEALKPLLKKHKSTLSISDQVENVGDLTFIESTVQLKTESDTFISKAQAGINPNKKGMDIAQSFGTSSSYARKYALAGMFLLDDNKDADSEKPLDVEQKIKSCQTLSQLKTVYSSLSTSDKTKYASLKDELKTKLK